MANLLDPYLVKMSELQHFRIVLRSPIAAIMAELFQSEYSSLNLPGRSSQSL